jgi:transcriptional regulator with XRE-family HTH domain
MVYFEVKRPSPAVTGLYGALGSLVALSQADIYGATLGDNVALYYMNSVLPVERAIADEAARIAMRSNTAAGWLTPPRVNADPVTEYREVSADMRQSRDAALAEFRRRLDAAKATDAARSARDIVIDLSETYGLNQLATARSIGVTPTAVRKWRRGEQARPAFLDRLAQLSGLLRLLRVSGQAEPAGWLEVPVSIESTLTPLDLFADGRGDLVLLLASKAENPQDVLSDFDPDWRTKYEPDREYEVVVQDGERVVVPRASDGE